MTRSTPRCSNIWLTRAAVRPSRPFFFMLPRIGVDGQDEVDALGPGLGRRVDGDEKGHEVVIDGENSLFGPVVDGDGLMILHVLKDVEVLSPHRIQDLGLAPRPFAK